MRSILMSVVLGILLALVIPATAAEQNPPGDTPWWQKKKVVFMWGQWNKARVDKSVDYWIGELPREHFRHVARAGGTVFADCVGMVKGHAWRPAHARYAHEFGIKYFATRYVGLPRYRVSADSSGREWVSARGDEPIALEACSYTLTDPTPRQAIAVELTEIEANPDGGVVAGVAGMPQIDGMAFMRAVARVDEYPGLDRA